MDTARCANIFQAVTKRALKLVIKAHQCGFWWQQRQHLLRKLCLRKTDDGHIDTNIS